MVPTWEQKKLAARVYSKYRPLAVEETITGIAGSVTPPTGTITVIVCDYGFSWTYAQLIEARLAGTSASGWAFHNGKLWVHPDTTEDVWVVWGAFHPPDEVGLDHPSIPEEDREVLDDLALAVAYDELAGTEGEEPAKYSVGHFSVDNTKTVQDYADRASRYRKRALQQLEDPLSEWG